MVLNFSMYIIPGPNLGGSDPGKAQSRSLDLIIAVPCGPYGRTSTWVLVHVCTRSSSLKYLREFQNEFLQTQVLIPFPSYTPEEPGNRLFILKYF